MIAFNNDPIIFNEINKIPQNKPNDFNWIEIKIIEFFPRSLYLTLQKSASIVLFIETTLKTNITFESSLN